uniref:Uncharacterized protein n=1 Tax=Arundo donax TaxID=35708 RepID=A0A0A9DYF1_ARUDO
MSMCPFLPIKRVFFARCCAGQVTQVHTKLGRISFTCQDLAVSSQLLWYWSKHEPGRRNREACIFSLCTGPALLLFLCGAGVKYYQHNTTQCDAQMQWNSFRKRRRVLQRHGVARQEKYTW